MSRIVSPPRWSVSWSCTLQNESEASPWPTVHKICQDTCGNSWRISLNLCAVRVAEHKRRRVFLVQGWSHECWICVSANAYFSFKIRYASAARQNFWPLIACDTNPRCQTKSITSQIQFSQQKTQIVCHGSTGTRQNNLVPKRQTEPQKTVQTIFFPIRLTNPFPMWKPHRKCYCTMSTDCRSTYNLSVMTDFARVGRPTSVNVKAKVGLTGRTAWAGGTFQFGPTQCESPLTWETALSPEKNIDSLCGRKRTLVSVRTILCIV